MLQRIKNNLGWIFLAGLLVGAVFVWSAVLAQETGRSDKIKIDFFDIGQGSAIFIAAPNGNQVLIDGGPSDAVLAKLGEAMPLGDRQIELLILTHPDADHLDGLVEVLRRYDVAQILETGIVDSTADYRAWNDLIKQKNIPVVLAQAGQVVKIADNLEIKILHPFGQIAGQDFKNNTNASSIVGKLIYGQNTMLFTGDAEGSVEAPLVFFGVNLKADILVVGHHGSKNSSSADFLAAVAPQIAVIQVGLKNKYGFPTQEVLDRLKTVGAKIFRTDLDGDIDFTCDLEKCFLVSPIPLH